MEKKIFNRDDIKAGYLLRCTDLRKDQNGRQFNMTVVPSSVLYNHGALACCNPGHDWAPLSSFNCATLIHANTYRIDEVWCYATPARAMDNSTEGRVRLWRRRKRMTLAEIQKELGYLVKIVEEGKDDKATGFKKSSLTAGMVVKLRDGTHRLVLPSEKGMLLAVTSGAVGCTAVAKYNADLTYPERADLDIVKIWGRVLSEAHVAYAFTAESIHRRCIWERDEVKRMTREEIEKALGYPVEIVPAFTQPSRVTIDDEGISFIF